MPSSRPWHLAEHAGNRYYAFTNACNASAPLAILASGQACVWYRLALASKDGAWIIRETAAACAEVLAVLAAHGARYRLGAPLDPRWLRAGWSTHFEAIAADGVRLRFDFVSRPPRIPASRLEALWQDILAKAPAVVAPADQIRLKQTMRLKDYPFIGALALRFDDPADQIRWTLDPAVLFDSWDGIPSWPSVCRHSGPPARASR